MQKIPCPSCGEPNFSTDIMCWKCGASLHKREQPEPVEPPVPEPAPAPVPEEVAAPEIQPNAIMEAVIAMETEEVTYQKNLVFAVIFGGIVGMLVNLLFSIPFQSWVHADSLPSSVILPFILITTIGAGIAGALAVYHSYGAVAGFVAYAASLILIRLIAVAPTVVAPPELWTYHLFSGFFIAYAGMLGAILVLRLMGRRIQLPAFSPKSPMNQKSGMMIALPVIIAVVLVLSISRYQNEISAAQNDPSRVVAGFCWAAASGWNGDASEIDYLITSGIAAKGSTLKPNYPLPSQRTIKSLILGSAGEYVQVTKHATTAEVLLKTSSDSSWTPNIMKVPGGEADSEYQIKFSLSQENGQWRISDTPSASMPGQL